MAKNNNLTDFLTDTANAIRTKKGTTGKINPQDFSSEIASIQVEKEEQEKSVTVTENGTINILPDSGKVLSKATAVVNVPSTPTQEKSVTITENGTTEVSPDSGKVLSKVTVMTSVPILDTSDATATADDILLGKTAYANGAKLTGTLEIGASGTPIDVATEEEMASILSNATSDDNGKIYRYTGTTGTYVNGALYWLEVPLVTK